MCTALVSCKIILPCAYRVLQNNLKLRALNHFPGSISDRLIQTLRVKLSNLYVSTAKFYMSGPVMDVAPQSVINIVTRT